MRRPDDEEEENGVEDGRIEVEEERRVGAGRGSGSVGLVGVRLRGDDGRKGGSAGGGGRELRSVRGLRPVDLAIELLF